MPQVKERITVNCPIEKAFNYTADFKNLAARHPDVISSKQTTSGPIGVGTSFDAEIIAGGRKQVVYYVIKEFEPPYRVVLAGDGGAQEIVDEFTFTEVPEATTITITTQLNFRGLMKLIGPFLGPTLRRGGRRAAQSLADNLTEG